MGRKNKEYFKDMHQQTYDKLTGMQAFGDSKKEDMKYDRVIPVQHTIKSRKACEIRFPI